MARQQGRYQHAKPKRRKPDKLIIILVSMVVFLVLCIAAMVMMVISRRNEQREFQELSAMVQQAATQTTVPETQPAATVPETAPVQTTAPTETTVPVETEPQMLPQYQLLYEQNPDVVGWVSIAGTKVDYPVMHTPQEPEKYLHLSFKEEHSDAGTPFLDEGCKLDSDNLLIYGHHMADGTMFQNIMNYQNQSYWKEHPVIWFDTLYEQQEFEVLAAFYDRVYYKHETCFKFYQFIDAADKADFDNAIAEFKKKSIYDTGVDAQYGDQLISLVTCAYQVENGRFVVVARKSNS